MRLIPAILLCALAATLPLQAQSPHPTPHTTTRTSALTRDIDPNLLHLILATPAFDNHAHPMLSPPAAATDRGFDALPVDNMPPQTDPIAYHPNNPQLPDAWFALYHIRLHLPLTPASLAKLKAARAAAKTRQGSHYSAWVLDHANIGTMSRQPRQHGSSASSHRASCWVPYVDALLFPLDNSAAATTPDRRQFFPLEDKLRAKYLTAANLTTLPPTLDLYLNKLIHPNPRATKSQGAVADKFEIAYLRPFGFDDPSPGHAADRTEAAAIYATLLHTGTPSPAHYKRLQDFLFRYIALEAGRLGMAVHIHTTAGGGGYFSITGDNPLLLEPLFNDPRFAHTNFVLLHGGWPFVHEIGAILQKPNVYLDLSQQALMIPPRTMSTWLREWLELYPEKVLFATDAYPYSDSIGWEEAAWIGSHNARYALALALTGMQRDGEISPARAAEIAQMVLRRNAEILYNLPHN